MSGKKLNWRAFGIWMIMSAVIAIALCPFAVWCGRLFAGDISRSFDPVSIYTAFDISGWASCLKGCTAVRSCQVALLALFLLVFCVPFAFERGAVFYVDDREVGGGILGDQHVYDKKSDLLRRNYTWNGSGKPPVYGLVMGGYSDAEIIFKATHAAIIAPSGSGKTRGSVYETIDLLSYGRENSMIVCDPSGEIYAMMADGLKARGYKSIFLLELNKGRRGDQYNPLQIISDCYRRGDGDSAEARAQEIGDILSPEQGGENDYFNRAAAGLIAAICYLVATLEEVPDERRTMWSVAQTVYKGTDGGAEALKDFIRGHGSESPAFVMASAFLASSDKTESNILSTVVNALQIFNTASMKYITGGCVISAEGAMREPTVVFMRVLPRGNQANKLASLFLAQHLAETLRQGDRGSLVPTYIIGDEFHAIPRFDLVTAVEQGRKYGLHYYMWVQSLAAFDTYSTQTEDGRSAVVANADVRILYKAGSDREAQAFQQLGGTRTIWVRNTSSSAHVRGVTDSEGYSEREVSNWTQGDLMARDPFKDGVLVFANISGEDKRNGKYVIPVPDVTATPTARNFPTFGSREHERRVISSVEARLDERAAEAFTPIAWVPDYGSLGVDRGLDHQADPDFSLFGI